jgi:perosamine synthetase
MRVRRTLPPAAAPLGFFDLWNGIKGFLAGASYNEKFKNEIREYFGVKHAFFASSGKASLYLILMAMKSLKPERSEVLIPAYTCFSVPSAIVRAGLDVALCDIVAASLDFDPVELKTRINEKTLCVIPGHLFGIPSKMDYIAEICRQKKVFVLEDAAQAMGGRSGAKLLGTIGDAGFFSLGRGKALTCGSGGIIVTDSDSLANAIQIQYDGISYPGRWQIIKEFVKTALMSVFIRPRFYWIPAAMPFLKLGQTLFDPNFRVERFSSMQAGLCLTWRKRLEKAISIRKEQAAHLTRKIKACAPAGLACIVSYLRLPVIVKNREEKKRICEISARMGLGIAQMYPSPVNEIPQIAHRFPGCNFPCARLVADTLISMPLHTFVNARDREEMVRLVAPALKAHHPAMIPSREALPAVCERRMAEVRK